MAEEESPVFHDILISTTAPVLDINEDSLQQEQAMETSGKILLLLSRSLIDGTDLEVPQHDTLWPSFDPGWIDSIKDEEISAETMSMDHFLSNSSFDFPQSKADQPIDDWSLFHLSIFSNF